MKAKTLSTIMKDLYGVNEYHKYIHVGDEFWSDAPFIQELTNKKWNKIRVTYIRSGVMFFTIEDTDIPEQYIPTKSFAAAIMIKAKIDPHKEFPYRDDLDYYRFDDKFTEVVNFDNRENKEIDDEYELLF